MRKEWNVVLYLFFETMSLFMVFSILFLSPRVDELSLFERFGYATASLGGVIFVSRCKHIEAMPVIQKGLVLGVFYVVFIWSLFEIIHRSPDLLNNHVKSYALKSGVSTLSRDKSIDFLKSADDFALRFTPSDHQVKSLHFAAFASLGALVQERATWHPYFNKKQFEEYVRVTSHLNRKYYLFDERYKDAYFSSFLSGAAWPFGSRVINQMALLKNSSDELFFLESNDYAKSYLRALNKIPSHYISERERWAIQDARLGSLVSRKIIESLNSKGGDVVFEQFSPMDNWEYSVRKSLTRNILNKLSLSSNTMSGDIAFPWYGAPKKDFDVQFEQVAKWNAPFLFNEQGQSLLSLSVFQLKDEHDKYIKHFSDDSPLSLGIKGTFDKFYVSYIHRVVGDPGLWGSPITTTLFNDVVRIGSILPFMLVLSMFLTFFNFYRLWRVGGKFLFLGLTSSFLGALVFFTPARDLVISLVVLFSVPKALLF